MVVGVDVLSERQRRARLPLYFVCLSRRRWRLCDWDFFMALVGCGGTSVIRTLVRVAVGERDGQRGALFGHGVQKRADKILAPTDEVVCVLRNC
jgi:hypothetical protein